MRTSNHAFRLIASHLFCFLTPLQQIRQESSMCYCSCVKEHILPALYAPAKVQKLHRGRLDQRGKAYERKSHGALPKLRTDIPTTEARKGLNQNKFLATSRRG